MIRAMRLAAALLLTLVPSAALAQTPTPTPAPFGTDQRPLLVPPQSVADPDGADAIVFNPSGLAFDSAAEFVYLHSDLVHGNRLGDGDAIYYKSARFLNLGIEWARPTKDTSIPLFTFSTGIPLDETISVGAGWSTTMGHLFGDTSYQSWNVGTLIRPVRFVSLGGTIWNATGVARNPGLDVRARYAGGLALRPLPMRGWNERLTLAADVAKTDGQKGEDVRWSLRFEPVRGLSLYATADDSKRYTGGLMFSFDHGAIGYQSFHDGKDASYSGSSTRLRVSQRRQPTVVHFRPAYAKLTVGGGLPDASAGTLFTPAEATLPELLRTLDAVKADPSVDGVLIHIKGLGIGTARTQEVRDQIAATRAAGKKVFCYAEALDLRSYYLATACDRIALHPAGMVQIDGINDGLGYMHGTLAKLGVEFEYARVGEYKGAVEPLTRDEPSKEMAEVVNQMLDGAFGMIVDGIAKGRSMEAGQVRALVDGGYYPAPQAKEQKLVDYLAYPDEVKKLARDFLGKDFAEIDDYRSEEPASGEWGAAPEIGIIYASGDIATGESRSAPLSGQGVLGSSTLVRALKQARDDGRIKAVVLRVDSPGGDGFASDQVWHEVVKLKKEKPVVVSMGDVAASGGYYIAMGSSEIFADPATITGSIGVFILRPNFHGLYSKLAYKKYDFSRGAMSELFDEGRPMTPAEKETLERLVNAFYKDFIGKAAQGRSTTPEAIDAIGRGHVWLGQKAQDLKLVDHLGGLEAAVDRARELAKIPKSRRVEWRTLPEAGGRFDPGGGLGEDVKAELRALPFGDSIGFLESLSAMGDGPIPWMPWRESLKPVEKVRQTRLNPWWPLPDFTRAKDD